STRWRARYMTPIGSPSRSSGTPSPAHVADGDNLGQSVFRVGGEIGNLDRLTSEQSPSHDAAASGLESQTPHARVPFGRKRESRGHPIGIVLPLCNVAHLGIAQPRSGFE